MQSNSLKKLPIPAVFSSFPPILSLTLFSHGVFHAQKAVPDKVTSSLHVVTANSFSVTTFDPRTAFSTAHHSLLLLTPSLCSAPSLSPLLAPSSSLCVRLTQAQLLVLQLNSLLSTVYKQAPLLTFSESNTGNIQNLVRLLPTRAR